MTGDPQLDIVIHACQLYQALPDESKVLFADQHSRIVNRLMPEIDVTDEFEARMQHLGLASGRESWPAIPASLHRVHSAA